MSTLIVSKLYLHLWSTHNVYTYQSWKLELTTEGDTIQYKTPLTTTSPLTWRIQHRTSSRYYDKKRSNDNHTHIRYNHRFTKASIGNVNPIGNTKHPRIRTRKRSLRTPTKPRPIGIQEIWGNQLISPANLHSHLASGESGSRKPRPTPHESIGRPAEAAGNVHPWISSCES
jgi:hypothetical protein